MIAFGDLRRRELPARNRVPEPSHDNRPGLYRFARALTLILLLASINCSAVPTKAGTTRAQAPANPQHDVRAPIRTFTGTIAKNGDQFVLREKDSQKWYQLDDQETAAKFDGKAVKVTGIFDSTVNIIRVRSIEEGSV